LVGSAALSLVGSALVSPVGSAALSLVGSALVSLGARQITQVPDSVRETQADDGTT